MKRLILLCDGTLEDADSEKNPALYTNIAKLARGLKDLDTRVNPPVEQIKLYQGGVGTEEAAAGGLLTGMLGRGMRRKVKALYDFLALNWQPGDEIYLFGFARGAYTVRLLCSLLDVIGILPPVSHHELFPALFEALDAHTGKGGEDDAEAQARLQEVMKPILPFRTAQLAALGERKLVECLGVFDTVGTRGRPAALRRSSPFETRYNSFGFDETRLPTCVARTYHALALDEHRIDYLPVLFRKASSTSAGQPVSTAESELLQVWFSGAHTDIGGGYAEGDLGAISLWWMVSMVQDKLAFDLSYLKRTLHGMYAAWGEYPAHNSLVPPYVLAKRVDRALPIAGDKHTDQFFHPSILSQPAAHLRPNLVAYLQSARFDSNLFVKLSPLEQQIKREWPSPIVSEPEDVKPNQLSTYATDEFGLGRPSLNKKSSVASFTDNESDDDPGSPAPKSMGSPPLGKKDSTASRPVPLAAVGSASRVARAALAALADQGARRNDMSTSLKRPRSPAVAIDPSLEGQYATVHGSSGDIAFDRSGQGQNGKDGKANKRRAKSAVGSTVQTQSQQQGVGGTVSDYSTSSLTISGLLGQPSGSIATKTATPFPHDNSAQFAGPASYASGSGPDLLTKPRSDILLGQGPSELYGLPSNLAFALASAPSDSSPPSTASARQGEAGDPALATAGASVETPLLANVDPPRPPPTARTKSASQPSLPETFPEAPPRVEADEGTLPSRSEFDETLEAYLQSLHAIKRNKALMPRELYDTIIQILRKPQATTIGDPQLRFWVRQRFQLMTGPRDSCCALHEGKRVVLRDEIYDVVAKAHLDSKHGGRDKTYTLLRQDWSYVPKETVATFTKLCPVCSGKRAPKEDRQGASRQAKEAPLVAGEQSRPLMPSSSSGNKEHGSSTINSLSDALGVAPADFTRLNTEAPNVSSSAASSAYLEFLGPYTHTTASSSLDLPVPPELASTLAPSSASDVMASYVAPSSSDFATAAAAAGAAAVAASRPR
ncbi:hypothetical protein JCM10908_002037 [Rhodotorula pacifica]|uniref:uncharacterized protein n=1 Tax=Rhodotorula pacifica TaxID=1495444 RepID=UPI0031725E9F